ncbi:NAD(P)/FAD-dependent oxidoreductase [Algoriphagus terrigena]|uniref:NAD(P)/FAD-dependent oxidoreductase n=1 Tax=Algoriphagus terrigena TaxID=344884 RepID=UPI00041FBEC5|nr:FAD-dependent oxidoreductase [Algoriphagus terrigena]
MFSYWEKKNFFRYDLIVIGSGFTGLSTAVHYKRKHPKASVLILEKGVLPTGASTKNAGFACFGSLTEILDDFWKMTPEEVFSLVERRYKGLCQIRENFGDARLQYKANHGFELLEAENVAAADQMDEVNKMLKKIFKKDVFSIVKKPGKFGFSDRVKLVVENQFEGELDPGAYLGALWEKASELGVKILTGVSVVEVQKDDGLIIAENMAKDRIFEFSGDKVAICTNAFSKKLWPESDVEPGRGLVLLSKPIAGKIPWKGSFHLDKGYVYFRKIDGRLLLGGARNKDFEKEKTVEFETNPKIKSYLQQLAREVILPNQEIEWEMEWTGIMAFGSKKSPLIQPIGEKTAVAVRLGGMGVALGWQVGKELSQLLSKM